MIIHIAISSIIRSTTIRMMMMILSLCFCDLVLQDQCYVGNQDFAQEHFQIVVFASCTQTNFNVIFISTTGVSLKPQFKITNNCSCRFSRFSFSALLDSKCHNCVNVYNSIIIVQSSKSWGSALLTW